MSNLVKLIGKILGIVVLDLLIIEGWFTGEQKQLAKEDPKTAILKGEIHTNNFVNLDSANIIPASMSYENTILQSDQGSGSKNYSK